MISVGTAGAQSTPAQTVAHTIASSTDTQQVAHSPGVIATTGNASRRRRPTPAADVPPTSVRAHPAPAPRTG